MIGDWGTDKYLDQQVAVADAMKRYIDQVGIHPNAMLLLGDNWYGNMFGGAKSKRWDRQFELMYPTAYFPGPMYAVLGNHDYEYRLTSKAEAQLAYQGLHPGTRWTMPNRWYRQTWPANNPQITLLCLDSNLPGIKNDGLNPLSYSMSPKHVKEQDAWLRAELAKPRTTPFIAVVAHHPLYTNGIHRDDSILINAFDKLLREYKVDFWITGHDHDLQHLEFAGHPTSFWISGGGGAELVDWTTDPAKRGPFGAKVLGFSGIEATPEGLILRHFDKDLRELHAFRKAPGGAMEIYGQRMVPVRA
jgi:hypothetical protein